MSSRRFIEISSPVIGRAFDQRLKQARLDRRVLVAAAQDVNAVRVLAEDERDVARRKRRLGWLGVRAPCPIACPRLNSATPVGKTPESRRWTGSANLCTYGVRGRLRNPRESMSASSNKSDAKPDGGAGNFVRDIIAADQASKQARRPRRDALSARAERLPAHRPRQGDLRRLRPGAGVRRHLQPALRRHQPDHRGRRVRRGDPGRHPLARLRVGRACTTPRTTSRSSTSSR